jgi:DNA topoisomerase-1
VLAGRYGPYVKHGAVNANVPKGADPTALTMDEAVALLAAREGAGGGKKRKAKPAPRTANVVKARKPVGKKAAKKKAAS